MQTPKRTPFIRAIISMMVVAFAILFALFGAGGLSTVRAQEQPTKVPDVEPTQVPMELPHSLPESSSLCTTCAVNPYRAYVGTFNPRGVIEFDTQNNTITRNGLAWPLDPHVSAMMPNGKQVFMAGWGDGTIYGLDTTTYQITTTIKIQGNDQRGLVISKDNTHMYVADNKYKRVTVIDLTTNKPITTIPLGAHPEQIALSPDDSKLYVAANTPGMFVIIDTATNAIIKSIPMGKGYVQGVYASRDGKKVFVSDAELSKLFVFDTSDFHKIAAVTAPNAFFLFSNVDGSKLYVLRFAQAILVIDTKTLKPLTSIEMGDRPLSAALTRDGVHMYVGLTLGSVAVLDTISDTVIQNIPVNGTPHAIAAILPIPVNPSLLIHNGGFNGYADNTMMVPQYWQAINFAAGDGKYTAAVQEGTASVKMDGASGVSKTLYQVLPLGGSSGDQYTFAYWVKGTAISVDANFCRGQVFVYNNNALVTAQTVDCPVHTYADFQKKTLTFTIPSDYNKVVVRFTYSKPTGRVWFDMVSLVKK